MRGGGISSYYSEKDYLINKIIDQLIDRPLPIDRVQIDHCSVEPVFTNIPGRIVEIIGQHDFVFGCVAWLSHEAIIEEASNKEACFIVQKQKRIRPRITGASSLVKLYEKFRPVDKSRFHNALAYAYMEGDYYDCFLDHELMEAFGVKTSQTIKAVRCVGVHDERGQTIPLMHHKFMVLGDWEDVDGGEIRCKDFPTPFESCRFKHRPKVVVTGSFNFTFNASRSLENIVIINSQELAEIYYQWFGAIALISEDIDWEKNEVDTDFLTIPDQLDWD